MKGNFLASKVSFFFKFLQVYRIYCELFHVLLPVNIGIILFNDQIDVHFLLVYVYFNSLHVSSIRVLIIRRFNRINTISGIRGVLEKYPTVFFYAKT